MDVISVTDGKNLGRVYDMAFTFPEGKVKGFYVTGCKGFRLTKSEALIPLSDVVRIGEDAILVRTGKEPKPKPDRCEQVKNNCPPQCFPPEQCCPPPFPPPGDPRRDFGDYE